MSTRSMARSMTALIALVAVGLAACNRGGDATGEEELPIVVEESGPIELGEPGEEPSEDEIDIVEEPAPRVVERVIVRERPAPTPAPTPAPAEEREERAEPEPARPTRPGAIPAGTRIPIATLAQIDSEHNDVGEPWSGRVTRDVTVNGFVVIPAGAAISGVVIAMDEGDRNDGRGSITLEARSVETVSGSRAIGTSPVSAGHSYADKGFPTKETGIGAGAGAVLGGIIGGKKGAAIGAAAGGAGGAAMGSARDDYEVALNAGSDLTFQLTSAVGL